MASPNQSAAHPARLAYPGLARPPASLVDLPCRSCPVLCRVDKPSRRRPRPAVSSTCLAQPARTPTRTDLPFRPAPSRPSARTTRPPLPMHSMPVPRSVRLAVPTGHHLTAPPRRARPGRPAPARPTPRHGDFPDLAIPHPLPARQAGTPQTLALPSSPAATGRPILPGPYATHQAVPIRAAHRPDCPALATVGPFRGPPRQSMPCPPSPRPSPDQPVPAHPRLPYPTVRSSTAPHLAGPTDRTTALRRPTPNRPDCPTQPHRDPPTNRLACPALPHMQPFPARLALPSPPRRHPATRRLALPHRPVPEHADKPGQPVHRPHPPTSRDAPQP